MTHVLSNHTLLHREIKKLLLMHGLKVRSLNACVDEQYCIDSGNPDDFGNPDFVVDTDSKDTFLLVVHAFKQREDLMFFTSTGARLVKSQNEHYLKGRAVVRVRAYGNRFVVVRVRLDTRTFSD